MNRWIPTAAAVAARGAPRRARHSSLARTTTAAATGTSAAARAHGSRRTASTSALAATISFGLVAGPGWPPAGLSRRQGRGGVAVVAGLAQRRSAQSVPGTDGAAMPFWSADGSRIGFFANGQLRVFDLASGQASDLADAPSARGGSWNAAGDLVFAPAANGGLMKRDAERIDRAAHHARCGERRNLARLAGVSCPTAST